MKTKIFFTITALFLITSAFSQTLELTFNAIDNATSLQLDSIKVMNRSQGGETVLYWPDVMLVLVIVGLPQISSDVGSFQVFQNYPNPVADQTTVTLYVPNKDKVGITITDILGRMIIQTESVLERGKHTFLFTPGSGNLYFFNAQWQGHSSSIKIQSALPNSNLTSSLKYTGSESFPAMLKATEAIQDIPFNIGDTLLYIGYANGLQSGILDDPETSETYTFQFATNIPCPGTPTVEYEGQIYNTIQVFSQCWLNENLNAGTMIQGAEEMTDNGTLEKYCYDNDTNNCDIYGGLYQWNEMMQYTTQQGAQGVCPTGWHLPTDEEWKVLEGAVDSQYGIGDTIWDTSGIYRGFDAGANLKTTDGWYANGNGTDLYGFSVLPSGRREGDGSFFEMGKFGLIWTSTEYSYLYSRFRSFAYLGSSIPRGVWSKFYGHSVRCLRD